VSNLLYPRLPRLVALSIAEKISIVASEDPRQLVELVAFEHPRASPIPTGGSVVQSNYIHSVRESVMEEVGHFLDTGRIPNRSISEFDRRVGVILHEQLEITPADAAHEGAWSFLALLVFPDVSYARFPDLHQDRLVGTKRNVLRRLWIRQDVLGDLTTTGDPPLGEDEFVGLLERTAMARNPRLVRALARRVIAYEGSIARSEFARLLYKRAMHTTGPLLLDVLSDEQLDIHVRQISI
jgi:hypothetical protein